MPQSQRELRPRSLVQEARHNLKLLVDTSGSEASDLKKGLRYTIDTVPSSLWDEEVAVSVQHFIRRLRSADAVGHQEEVPADQITQEFTTTWSSE